jgi:magnesium-transporting ATPase (P-type)
MRVWEKTAFYFKRYPARVAGYLASVTLYINKEIPYLPSIIIPSVIFLIGLGEVAQRAEDNKAVKALRYKSDPDVPDRKEISIIVRTK